MGPIRALVESSPQAGISTPAQTAISTTAGIVLAANAKRKGFWAQNTGTTVIYLSFGLVMPTGTAYHMALGACTAGNDGTGGVYFESNWVGQLNALSSAPGGTFILVEITTGSPDWNLTSDWGIR